MNPRGKYSTEKIGTLVLVVVALALLSGCEDLSRTVDGVLGKSSPVLSSSQEASPGTLVPVKKRSPGARPPTAEPEAAPAPYAKPPATATKEKDVAPTKVALQGKKRAPGALSPGTQEEAAEAESKRKRVFRVGRDPFKTPTEILPSECPPSMPLCRFEYSQLKLVGVIQVEDGGFKGMVEDPDGRGYFVTAGMQIGRATVTQVTKNGLTLHEHRSRQIIPIPLPNEGRESPEL